MLCLNDRQFLFSHILLSVPLLPTLSAIVDGNDLKTQGHSKIPEFLWCVQICHTEETDKEEEMPFIFIFKLIYSQKEFWHIHIFPWFGKSILKYNLIYNK